MSGEHKGSYRSKPGRVRLDTLALSFLPLLLSLLSTRSGCFSSRLSLPSHRHVSGRERRTVLLPLRPFLQKESNTTTTTHYRRFVATHTHTSDLIQDQSEVVGHFAKKSNYQAMCRVSLEPLVPKATPGARRHHIQTDILLLWELGAREREGFYFKKTRDKLSPETKMQKWKVGQSPFLFQPPTRRKTRKWKEQQQQSTQKKEPLAAMLQN